MSNEVVSAKKFFTHQLSKILKSKPAYSRLNVHIRSDLYELLKHQCSIDNKSISKVVNELILGYLNAHFSGIQNKHGFDIED